MRERLLGLKDSMITIAGECMKEKEIEIKELLIDQQQINFTDSDGAPLRTYYRKYVFDFSNSPSPFSLPTKFMEELTSELYLAIDGEFYTLNSDSVDGNGELKSEYLTQWNGSEIMKLTPENEAKIYPIIQDLFVRRCNEELALD